MRAICLAVLATAIATARPAAAPRKYAFIFKGVDEKRQLAILHPIVAPNLGAQLASGSPRMRAGESVFCEARARTSKALVDGVPMEATELVLDCGDRVFVVKAVDFEGGG